MKAELEKLSKETLVRKLMNIHNITEKEYNVETLYEEQDRRITDIIEELQPGISVLDLCRVMSKLEDNELNRDVISKVYTSLIHNQGPELNQILETTFSDQHNERNDR